MSDVSPDRLRSWPSCPWPQPDRSGDAAHLARRAWQGDGLRPLDLDPVTTDEEDDPRFHYREGPRG